MLYYYKNCKMRQARLFQFQKNNQQIKQILSILDTSLGGLVLSTINFFYRCLVISQNI